jgi:hypothetical protein
LPQKLIDLGMKFIATQGEKDYLDNICSEPNSLESLTALIGVDIDHSI